MAKVKILYVKNLTAEVTEEKLRELFGPFGPIERVKKIKGVNFRKSSRSQTLISIFFNFRTTPLFTSRLEMMP